MPLRRILAICLIAAVPVLAQAPPDGPSVTAGHIHLNSADPDAAIGFWRDVIGASTVSSDSMKGVGMSGATIFFAQKAASGPSAGSAIDHLAVRVADLQPFIKNLAKTTYKSTNPQADKSRLMIDGPDGVLIEMIEDSSMYTSVEFSHIHLYSTKPQEMQAWYAGNFGGRLGTGENADSVQIPGATLTFTRGDSPVPTAGRAVDHLGFEVKNIDSLRKKLSENGARIDTPAHADPGTKAMIAFVTDPWGTSIELIERVAR